jgi:hypothetical protein
MGLFDKRKKQQQPARQDRGRAGSTPSASRDIVYDPLTDLTSPMNPASPIWHDPGNDGCRNDHGGVHDGGSSGGGCGGGGGE